MYAPERHQQILDSARTRGRVEVAPGEVDDVRDIVSRRMSGAAELRVPLDVSVGLGSSWDAAAH